MGIKVEKRKSPRKLLDPIHVADIEAMGHAMIVAYHGKLLNASATGLLISINRSDLKPDLLDRKVPLEAIEGDDVVMKIVEMELKIDARVVRTRYVDEALCEIAVDFADMVPTYWRDCLVEFLPDVGEMEQVDASKNA